MANIVKYETEHGEVSLSADIVRRYLVSGNDNAGNFVTNEEIVMFVKMCQFQKLNPFLREAYLIKYSANGAASMVTGKDVFMKRAFRNPQFDGFEAGITVKSEASPELVRREGALLLSNEVIIAGWCRVYLKNAKVPVFAEVSFDEYAGRKSDGNLNKTWKGKPATMIRKVAVVQALREAFPEDLGGLYDSAEMQQDSDALPEAPIVVEGEEVVDVVEETVQEPTRAPETPAEPVEAPQEPEAPVEPAAEPVVEDEPEPAYVPSNEYLKTVKFPKSTSPYSEQFVVDVVKTDLEYCERVVKATRSDDLRRDVSCIVIAWKDYLAREAAKEAAIDATVDAVEEDLSDKDEIKF